MTLENLVDFLIRKLTSCPSDETTSVVEEHGKRTRGVTSETRMLSAEGSRRRGLNSLRLIVSPFSGLASGCSDMACVDGWGNTGGGGKVGRWMRADDG